jgi:NAD(P)H-flavin reductase
MPEDFQPLAVLDAWDETPSLRGLKIDLGREWGELHRVPGQVVKLRAPEVGDGYFALANAPAAAGVGELLVKRGGAVADAVIARAAPGAEVHVSAPHGRGFPVEAARGRDVLLFAAGSGITPIRALVQHLIADRKNFGRVALFYGQRGAADFAYAREFPEWERAGVRVFPAASRPDGEWAGERGYVQAVAPARAFGELRLDGAAAFVAGMKPMVAGVREALAAAGLPPDRLYLNF